ncbi:MAG: hypothetical protein RMJ82_07470, partial [Gemmatales bacterium]|nr:hypothetical protein [Gemmatales bacterium]
MRRPSQRSLWLGFLALAGLVVHSQLATYTYAQRRVQVQPAPGVPDKALPDKAVPDKTVPQPAFVPELLKKHQQDLAEAAKKVQEAAAKGDLKELEQALRQMQAVLDKVRQGVREIPDQL